MKKFLLNHLLIFFFIFVNIGFFNIPLSLAEDYPATIMPGTEGNFKPSDCAKTCDGKACKQYCGDYQVNDFIFLGIRITRIILGFVGVLAFAAFIYGGLMFLISAGDSKRVQNGKDTMKNAVIGIVIILLSYLIIQFTLETLGYTKKDEWNVVPDVPTK